MLVLNSENLVILNGTIEDEVYVKSGTVKLEDVKMDREGRCISIHGGDVIIGSGCDIKTTGNSATVAIFGVEDGSDEVPSVTVEGKITNSFKYINKDGVYEQDGQFALSGNGSSKYGPTTMIVKPGAEIVSEHCVAIYHPNGGELNITGGTVKGLTALNTKGGTVNISGGTLKGTGNWDWRYSFGGAYSTGDAIAIENIGYPKAGVAGPVVNITGTPVITSNNRQAVEVFYAERTADNKDVPASHITLTDNDEVYTPKLLEYINNSVHIANTATVTPALYTALQQQANA